MTAALLACRAGPIAVGTPGVHKKVAAPRETAYFDGNVAGPAS